MAGDPRGATLPRVVDAALREFVNALSKAGMYPLGHRFVVESTASLITRLDAAMVDRDSLTISILPHGLLLDGAPVESLPGVLRQFAVRMHRKNIAVIHLRRGLGADEVVAVLGALAAGDADETVGRDGLRLEHARIDPMTYDLVALAADAAEQDLDDRFWVALAEAAFDRRMTEGAAAPTIPELADAIAERTTQGAGGARRVFEALSTLASALTGRGEQGPGAARQRFGDLVAALSTPTIARVVAAAPSPASRRRFVTDTVELVAPAVVIQVLDAVAEADGERLSPALRSLLGKLVRAEGTGDGGFVSQVLGLVEQWGGTSDQVDEATDVHVGVDPTRVLGLGLELEVPSGSVVLAARELVAEGQTQVALQLLDDPRNDASSAGVIRDAVLEGLVIESLLAEPAPDFALIERVAVHAGTSGAGQLLDALEAASDRTTRRRLIDILVRIGTRAEATLLDRLEGAPWYLARNILVVLAQFPPIANVEPVFTALSEPELRVRQEALKVLVRQHEASERAVRLALESGEETLVRMALTALGGDCPAKLVPNVLAVLDQRDEELRVQAIRALADTNSRLILPRLLRLVRARRGVLRRLRLQPKSPTMLAALELLSRRWRMEGAVIAVMHLARASADPEIRAVATGGR